MTKIHRFGRCELRQAERQLCVDSRPVPLGARAFDLLVALIEQPHRVVSKNELLDRVWPGVVVEEGNIAVHVAALRKVLGTKAIATIPGRGYQFAATFDDAPAVPIPAVAVASQLYGRAADIDRACGLLQTQALVSIVGPPGIGKTRVAQTVADRLRDRYPDGVHVVDLTAIAERGLVAGTLALATGIPMHERPSTAGVVALMQRWTALLVLDNCEHVLGGVAPLVEMLLRQARGVRLLATSQAPLRCEGEHVLRLLPLAVPDSTSVDDPLRYPAVELFCARALAADPHFVFSEANREAVIDICWRLDGIPLAIELAVARLHMLGVEGLRARLDHRLRLLTTGLGHAPHKQQTLRAALQWSHGLLSADEQVVFRRLAIFAGRFTLEAAQHVAATDAIDEWAVLEHLGTLVERSLVVVEGEDAARCYRLLETMRMFGLEQLNPAREVEAMRRRHAQATLAVLEAVDASAWTMTRSLLQTMLEPELDNVRAALAWAKEPDGDPTIGIALVARSSWLWESLNLVGEGIAHAVAFERAACEPLPLSLQAAYWRARVFHHWGFGVAGDAEAMTERAVELTRRAGDASALLDALHRAAIAAARAGHATRAAAYVRESRALERADWPPRQLATARFAEAEWCEAADRLHEARACHVQRIALLERAGELSVQMHAHAQLVALDAALGATAAAIEYGQRVMASVAPQFPPVRSRWLMVTLAQALLAAGRMDDAVGLAVRAVPLLRGSTAQWQTLDFLAQLWAQRGDAHRAATLLACADAMYGRRGYVRKPHVARARDRLYTDLVTRLSADDLRRAEADGTASTDEDAVALGLRFPS